MSVSRTQAKYQDCGGRELITVLECIYAGGRVIPPLIIYKGKHQYHGWHEFTENLDCKGYQFANSLKGWTNRGIGLAWVEHFNKSTRLYTKGSAYRLLILDGHDSHGTIEFIEFCISNRIVLYVLPSNATHLLQPLDVGIFGPLQKAYGKYFDNVIRYGNTGIRKASFLPILVKSRAAAFTTDNIISSFRKCGIVPLMPEVVLNQLQRNQDRASGWNAGTDGFETVADRMVGQLGLNGDEEISWGGACKRIDVLKRL